MRSSCETFATNSRRICSDFFRSESVSSSCTAMSLKVRVSTPISSFDSLSTLSVKSPPATFSAARVRSWMGAIIVFASSRLRSTEMMRPTPIASSMIVSSWLFRSCIVARLSMIYTI